MKSLSSYLLLMFMVMFWIFRIIVAFTTSMGLEFGFTPMNMNVEIILLFITFICILLVGKTKLIGGVIYLIAYGAYFGVDLYNIVLTLLNGEPNIADYSRAMSSFIGVVIPVAVVFVLLFEKNKTAHPVDKKTDWFYKNDEFNRKLDERSDQNQYRNY